MAFGNVIPIDDEIARRLARRQIRFRWLVAGLTAGWAALLVPTIILSPLPPLAPFMALAVLVVLAEHRFVLFGDETSMSASIIVIVASVFVFADTSPFAGPMLVASLGGLYVPHLRQRNWSLLLANVSIFSLAAAVAAFLAVGIEGGTSPRLTVWAIAMALLASGSYWCCNSVLTGCAAAIRNDADLPTSVRNQIVSEWPLLLLTTAAGLAAIANTRSWPFLFVVLALILCVFEFHTRQQVRANPTHASLHSGAVLVGLAASVALTSSLGIVTAAVAAFLFVANPEYLHGRSFPKAGLVITAFVGGSLMDELVLSSAVRFAMVATFAILAMSLLETTCKDLRTLLRLPPLVVVGLLVPGRTAMITVAAIAASLVATQVWLGDRSALLAALGIAATTFAQVGRPGGPRLRVPRSRVAASR